MSSDEEEFEKVLLLTGRFYLMKTKSNIHHHKLPYPYYLEVDNIAQTNTTLFLFEGKSKKEEDAIHQLKNRLQSLKQYKEKYIVTGTLNDFLWIRTFWYSFRKNIIAEYNEKGRRIMIQKFNDKKDLVKIIKKV